MPRVAPNLPAETDLLCEACGYTLNGLPEGGNCPECGQPIEQSIAPIIRQPSAWERDRDFLSTTVEVIFHPSRFFRHTTTRGDRAAAFRFGTIHTTISAALFAGAGVFHFAFETDRPLHWAEGGIEWCGLTLSVFWAMTLLTRLAARLTTWEATYRGIRLPIDVVRRGLAFHAAHYLPLGIAALATTAAYQIGLYFSPNFSIHGMLYLEVLSGEVILGAAYLFNTYWIAMRKMMYANY